VIPSMAVRELLTDAGAERLGLELLAGEQGLDTAINRPRIQKPGLALAGFIEYIYPGRVQILGKAEMTFLHERPPSERSRIMAQLCRQGASCFVVTGAQAVPAQLVEIAELQSVPLMTSGQSGHRLVSDDVVEIKRKGDILVGTGPELTRYHMELRGVGIVSVKDLFGVAAVRFKKYVEYVIRLDPWKDSKRYDRLGLDEGTHEILGVDLPYAELPVGPGRNLSVLIEVAARNHLLKLKGYHPAKQLARRLDERLATQHSVHEDEETRGAVIPDGEDQEL